VVDALHLLAEHPLDLRRRECGRTVGPGGELALQGLSSCLQQKSHTHTYIYIYIYIYICMYVYVYVYGYIYPHMHARGRTSVAPTLCAAGVREQYCSRQTAASITASSCAWA
jgi:hypothetical protein